MREKTRILSHFAVRGRNPVNAPAVGLAQAPQVREPASSIWLPTAILIGLFLLLIFNQQRLEWTVNAVYSYGWAVPALALFLFWERWRRRPVVERPGSRALLGL